KVALELAQGHPHLGDTCNNGGGLTGAGPAQARIVKRGWVQGTGCIDGGGRVLERFPPALHVACNGSVKQTGVAMGPTQTGSDPLGQGAFARRGRPIDGDDHGRTPGGRPPRSPLLRAPSPTVRLHRRLGKARGPISTPPPARRLWHQAFPLENKIRESWCRSWRRRRR